MNARTIRRAAERQARKAEIKAQKSQTYAGTPELTATATVSDLKPRPFAEPKPKTASPAQIAANRATAQLSCGPTSPEGKAKSARNHTVHVLTAEVSGAPFTVFPGKTNPYTTPSWPVTKPNGNPPLPPNSTSSSACAPTPGSVTAPSVCKMPTSPSA